MTMFDRIHEEDVMTHMPFLILDGQGELVLFYCRSGPEDFDAATHSRRWKLWVALEDDQPRRLETGLSDDLMECAPTAWFDATGWHVTFIAGGAKDNPLYHLYRMDGPALDRLSEPMSLQATRAGFVFGDRLAHADPENLIHVRQPSGDFDIELPGAFIYRVSYRADAPDRLLISGQWQTETDVIAIEYDVATGEQHLLEFDGLPAYKCTILGDQVLYAQRIGEHFENRRINESTALLRRSINTLVRRLPGQVQPIVTQPTGDCGCRGRSGEGDALTPGGAPPGSGEENHDHAGPDDVPVSRDEWPLWAKTIARLAASEDRGVGDTIARTIGPVGGDAFKEWYAALTGHPTHRGRDGPGESGRRQTGPGAAAVVGAGGHADHLLRRLSGAASQAARRLCVDLIYIDPPFNSNRNYEVFAADCESTRRT